MPHTSLPVELTSFVGRERELLQAGELALRHRLLTLTGVGGSGKTRLAIQLASQIGTEYRDGTAFVELAPLSDPEYIAPAIAQAIGLVETTGQNPEDAVVAALTNSETLLVVDNCEHLIEKCAPIIQRLLEACADLRVLATSRQPLDVPGEAIFVVLPLTVPSAENLARGKDLQGFEAVRLFSDRIASASAGFIVDDNNGEIVARICSQLDGLPLAIELAAARARSMSLHEILQRLDDRFSLLARGSRTATPRHRALRATVDWSHDLLTEEERLLFRRLAVFSGGWTLQDAQSVCTDERLPRDHILDIHSRLADQSLIVTGAVTAPSSRYGFLETIRQYATQRLEEADEVGLMRQQHFKHFLELAERYYSERSSGGSDAGLIALAAQRDNFRAALTSARDADPERALRLTSALDDFWRMIGAVEGWRWLQQALQQVPADSPNRVRAHLTAGMLAAYVPAYAEGAGLLRSVVTTARQTGDLSSEAWAELWLGRLAFFGEDVSGAERHLESALSLHEQLGIPLGRVRALALLGLLQAVVLERRQEGQQKLRAAAELARQIEDGWGEGYAQMMLGICAADSGDAESTRFHSSAALRASVLGPLLGVPLQQLARVVVEADPGRAMRIMGAAAGHFERTGTVEPVFLERRAEAVRRRAAQLLGPGAATRRFEEGRKLTTAQAIEAEVVDPEPVSHSRPGGLTTREVQVAALVGRHQSNRDIASALFISVRTAESHVDHILAKLSLNNRTELGAWARRNDLVLNE